MVVTNDNILNKEFRSDSKTDLVYVFITKLPFILFIGGMIFLALFMSFGILGKVFRFDDRTIKNDFYKRYEP